MAATVKKLSLLTSNTKIHHDVAAMTSSIADIDQRHHKLLQNIVKILQINNLLEEYRKVVRNIQQNCCCKRNKMYLERINMLESKYKELIVESCRTPSSSSSSSSPNTGANRISNSNGSEGENLMIVIPSNNLISSPSRQSSTNSHKNNNNITVCDSDINNNDNGKDQRPISPPPAKKMKLRSPMKILSINDNESNSQTKQTSNSHGSNGQESIHQNNIVMSLDENDDVNLIEEEEVLEDEDDDDVEEELDIEEFMALSEILEKERGQNKFEKEEDSKNELILVIRDVSTKEVICYECTVGGNCGFLSRERARMLLHISKHFENDGDEEEEEEDEEEEDEEDDDDEEEDEDESLNISKDVDISIIPVNADPITTSSTILSTPNSSCNSDSVALFKKEEGSSSTKSKSGGIMSPTSKLMKQQQRSLLNHSNKTQKPQNTQARNQASIKLEQQQDELMLDQQLLNKPGFKPIRCEWNSCNFMCDQNYKLRTHIRQVHEKVRPYLCDWPGCFGAYKTRSNLASHRMVHTGERPYVCGHPRCGAKFARKYDCERHRRIHSEKMYPCEWPGCGKRLCDPYNLERHMMVHKGELPFRCPMAHCVRGFRELRYLRDHMVNTHKILPDTNELRMACSNSSQMVSIIGYNLNENNMANEIMMDDNSTNSNQLNSASSNADDIAPSAFVSAIVTTVSPSAGGQKQRPEGSKNTTSANSTINIKTEPEWTMSTRSGSVKQQQKISAKSANNSTEMNDQHDDQDSSNASTTTEPVDDKDFSPATQQPPAQQSLSLSHHQSTTQKSRSKRIRN